MSKLAPETLERLSGLSSREILETMRRLAYESGGGSAEYVELMEEMVEQGLLAPEEIDRYEELTGS